MDLKILGALLVYYFFLIGIATFVVNPLDVTTNIDLNVSDLSDDEVDTGGLFGQGVDFGRFAGFVLFGIGLPSDTPILISIIFGVVQSLITIFSVGWFVSSIWNG